jgi:hypothetical protein
VTDTLAAAACGLGVAVLCVVLRAQGGVRAGLGLVARRVGAAIVIAGLMAGVLIALTPLFQLLDRLEFMQAYQRQFPDVSPWMIEQVMTLVAVTVLGFLVRRGLPAQLLAGLLVLLIFSIPLLASVCLLGLLGVPVVAVVEGRLWITGKWPSGWPGVAFGAVLGAAVGVAHGLIIAVLIAVLIAALAELDE